MNPPGRARTTMLPFWFGTLVGVTPWISIAYNIVAAETVPGFVYGIVLVQACLFFSFGLNQWLQYRGAGRWSDYAYGEKTYLVLSLAAKSLLSWQISVARRLTEPLHVALSLTCPGAGRTKSNLTHMSTPRRHPCGSEFPVDMRLDRPPGRGSVTVRARLAPPGRTTAHDRRACPRPTFDCTRPVAPSGRGTARAVDAPIGTPGPGSVHLYGRADKMPGVPTAAPVP
ncbi:heliorhodopsin HeR [Streptomyces lavendulocolor]|uniref:heliorhodopsin HeR n=1 Tax=Streptomyces lavendulocolor TaxID=67316 RepID=UPI003C2C4B53